MAWGKCKLCNKNGLLIGKSHIIPNFMYKGLFDEENKMVMANLKDQTAKDKNQYTGYFDRHILCHNCEKTLLGKLDNYAASLLYGPIKKSKVKRELEGSIDQGLVLLKISNIEYLSFLKFILSVCWRSHVSKQGFFKEVNIGPWEESIRRFLLDEINSGEVNCRIMVLGILDKNGFPIKLIIDPIAKVIPHGRVAIFFINGFLYQINFGDNIDDDKFEKFYLKTTGEITIPLLSGSLGRKMFETLGLPDNIVSYFTAYH